MPRYLLAQWTGDTLAAELQRGSHGEEPYAVPSSHQRLLELAEDDTLLVAAVIQGRLHPVCYLVVDSIAELSDLRAVGEDLPYPLRYQALAKPPYPRMNLLHRADAKLSLSVRKEGGKSLARRASNARALDGQGFRLPQWLEAKSAQSIIRFLDDIWDPGNKTGIHDPELISRGLAPHLTTAERQAIEDRAMLVVVDHYSARGYAVEDVHTRAPWI